jgi:hypothetical protein
MTWGREKFNRILLHFAGSNQLFHFYIRLLTGREVCIRLFFLKILTEELQCALAFVTQD